jgi:hypothetical protein
MTANRRHRETLSLTVAGQPGRQTWETSGRVSPFRGNPPCRPSLGAPIGWPGARIADIERASAMATKASFMREPLRNVALLPSSIDCRISARIPASLRRRYREADPFERDRTRCNPGSMAPEARDQESPGSCSTPVFERLRSHSTLREPRGHCDAVRPAKRVTP